MNNFTYNKEFFSLEYFFIQNTKKEILRWDRHVLRPIDMNKITKHLQHYIKWQININGPGVLNE